jgi:4-hydroxybutyryl-CoA dehydratase/vinylacetyl-CoA-Delta-isomerase
MKEREPSGTYFIDTVLANASKIHEGKEMAESTRLMVDICGGFVASLPSDWDLENPESAPLSRNTCKGLTGCEKPHQALPPGEKLALESAGTVLDIQGSGSPEAHRVTIFREVTLDEKKEYAKRLAGIRITTPSSIESARGTVRASP